MRVIWNSDIKAIAQKLPSGSYHVNMTLRNGSYGVAVTAPTLKEAFRKALSRTVEYFNR